MIADSNPSGKRLSKQQKALLTSASMGYVMWGVVASIGPLTAAGEILSGNIELETKVFTLLIPTLSLLAGNIIMGIFSDLFGRKNVFFITLLLYGAGIFIVFSSATFPELAVGLALAEFGAGGEEPPSLAIVSEDFSPKRRGRYLTLIPNFNNIGTLAFYVVLLLAIVPGRTDILVFGFGIIAIALFSRLSLPESFRWQNATGRKKDAEVTRKELVIEEDGIKSKKPNQIIGIMVLSMLGVSQYLTFGLMSYVIGPYEFPGAYTDNMIVAIGMAGASLAGFFAIFMINRSRSNYTLFSFGGGFVSIIVIFLIAYLNLSLFLSDPLIYFYPILFISMMFSEFAWASRTTLEPELFTTTRRASSIGLIRVFPMIAYALSVIYTSSLSLTSYILFNVFLWGLGLSGAIILKASRIETSNVSLDYFDPDITVNEAPQ